MKKILLTGANGQLGQEFAFLAKAFPPFDFTFLSRKDLDITSKVDVEAVFTKNDFIYCINCAAYTAVDKAETEQELAQAINVTGIKNLGIACEKAGIPIIHFSTDYVYHNTQNTPFVETDVTNPQSVYAQTKLNGELALMRVCKQAMVIRTSWVYSSFGNNFVKTMLRLGEERDNLGIVFDQIGTPTYARDLATAVLQILSKVENGSLDKKQLAGIYHYSNEGVCSWYDFAMAIFDNRGVECNVSPIESKAYPTPAKRPPFSVLNKEKIKSTFGLEISHWRDALCRSLKN